MSYPSAGGQYGPPPGPPPAPSAGPTSAPRRRSLVLAALAGFVLAVLIVVVLYFADALPSKDSSTSGAISTDSVSLPVKVGPYVRFQDAKINQQSRAASSVARVRTSDQRTAQALASAHGGAGASVQTYTDQELTTTFSIWAVRGGSPGLVVPYQDPKALGLAVAPLRTQKFGAVTCEISSQPTPSGQTPSSDATFTQACLRTGSKLSVIFSGGGTGAPGHHPDRCAELVDQVWATLS